jgi:hypothetical protein
MSKAHKPINKGNVCSKAMNLYIQPCIESRLKNATYIGRWLRKCIRNVFMHVFSCYFFPKSNLPFVIMTSKGNSRIWGRCRCLRSIGFMLDASNVLHLGQTGGYQDGFGS